jgi:hypothetical protein
MPHQSAQPDAAGKSPHRWALDTSETLPFAGVDQVCDLGSWQRMSGSGVAGANGRDVALAGGRCPCRAGDCLSFILRIEQKPLAVDHPAVLRDRHVNAEAASASINLACGIVSGYSPPCSTVSKRKPVPSRYASCGRLSGVISAAEGRQWLPARKLNRIEKPLIPSHRLRRASDSVDGPDRRGCRRTAQATRAGHRRQDQGGATSSEASSAQCSEVLNAMTRTGSLYWPDIRSVMVVSRSASLNRGFSDIFFIACSRSGGEPSGQ